MVLKKLGVELMDEFLATVQFLGDHEGMQVSAAPGGSTALHACPGFPFLVLTV